VKRHAFVVFAALLLAVPAAAQYTVVFQGDQLTIDRTEVGSVLIAAMNVPWSMPPIENNVAMHGFLEGTPEQLFVQFDGLYIVRGDIAYYLAATSLEWQIGKTFEWEPTMGCYVRWTPDPPYPPIVDFEIISVHLTNGLAYLFEGRLRFSGHPPDFWEIDPGAWMLQWQIEPFPYRMFDLPAVPMME